MMNIISDNKTKLLTVDTSDDEDDLIHDGKRRGSNVSLSRFRSCPQLLDEVENQQRSQRFEQTTDDSCTHILKQLSPFSPIGDTKFFEQNGRVGSETPTPPSSPKSRKSLLSLRESQSTGANQSPTSTPRLLRRSYIQRSSLSRGSSADSPSGSRTNSISLTEENIRHHEVNADLSQMIIAHPDKKIDSKTLIKHKHIHGHSDETQIKCEQWLQTLNVSKPDKIKSRSHIQLPPI
ncbi:unnamed protein product [Mytilus coruscus]|uniref:Uncharacterized protein n=1 Tax=Mytilus coruscus TaxID=42192 RepID=A0A6J8CZL8_MYTCO|nr:unnamed protein product [Mytilus coruscus]